MFEDSTNTKKLDINKDPQKGLRLIIEEDNKKEESKEIDQENPNYTNY